MAAWSRISSNDMSRNGLIAIAVVVVLFVLVGAYVVTRGTGGGGQSVDVSLKVTGSSMDPSNPTVKQNDSVTMTVTTDRDEEVHLHGYDIAFECKARRPLARTFKADKTGEFEIEIEDGARLGSLTVKP